MMTYTERMENMLCFVGECPETDSPANMADLVEALSDWSLVLESDIERGDKEAVRSDRANMQKLRLEIRELKAAGKENSRITCRGEKRG